MALPSTEFRSRRAKPVPQLYVSFQCDMQRKLGSWLDEGTWIHDDTVSPRVGQSTLGALFTGNFWEHGIVDLFGGTFFVGAFDP
jgi:hypothetical protein